MRLLPLFVFWCLWFFYFSTRTIFSPTPFVTTDEAVLFVRMGYEFAKGETTVKSVVKGDSFEEVENRLKNLTGYDDEARGRFIGHGLGLELDELPILGPVEETILKGNMTFPLKSLRLSPNLGRSRSKKMSSLKPEGVRYSPESKETL
jgi:hypothetical protein